jgi:hypothetical protein
MSAGLGVLLVVLGVANAAFPYKMARFEEQLDSIGSKRTWEEVEPADWKVSLTRISGVVFVPLGLALVFG